MGAVVGEVLPLAIGVAVSPIPVIAAILMLFSARAASSSTGFLLGWGRLSVTTATRPSATWSRSTGASVPVTKVDVSLTGEGDWCPAQLEPPKGPYQWQDWSFRWDSEQVGRHTLRARATDAAGVQPDVPPWNRLGYNAIEVRSVDRR
jgi:hypothetical protein